MLTDVKNYSGINPKETVDYYEKGDLTCYIFRKEGNRYLCHGEPEDHHEGVADKIARAFHGWEEGPIYVIGIDQDGEFGVLDVHIRGIYTYYIDAKYESKIPRDSVAVNFYEWKYPIYLTKRKGKTVAIKNFKENFRQYVPPEKYAEFREAHVPMKKQARWSCDQERELPYLVDKMELRQAEPLHRGKWNIDVANALGRGVGKDLIIRRKGSNILWETRLS